MTLDQLIGALLCLRDAGHGDADVFAITPVGEAPCSVAEAYADADGDIILEAR